MTSQTVYTPPNTPPVLPKQPNSPPSNGDSVIFRREQQQVETKPDAPQRTERPKVRPYALSEAVQQDGLKAFLPVPNVAISFSVKDFIDSVNYFLAISPAEMYRERAHDCVRLEQILIKSGNFAGYRFLEATPRDLTRREYVTVPRLQYTARYLPGPS